MNSWLLRIELGGEWEECFYPTQAEALSAFVAVAADYGQGLSSVVLECSELRTAPEKPVRPEPVYIN